MIQYSIQPSWLGSCLIAQSERGVCALLLGEEPECLVADLQQRFPKERIVSAGAGAEQLGSEVACWLETPGREFVAPLDIRGTDFQKRVWRALREIPYGQTWHYTQLAEHLGAPGAVRAVGRACGANPIAVAIPCHRVLRRDGALAGYRWGLERKQLLLEREREE